MRWLTSRTCIPVWWIATIGILTTLTLALSTGCAGYGNQWVDSDWLEPTSAALDSFTVTYTWTRPTTGTPVHHYLVWSTTGQEWIATKEKKRITVPADTPHRVRVQGVDADGNVGPWSEYSKEYPGIAGSDTVGIDIDNPIRRGR